MSKIFDLKIVDPDKIIYEGKTVSLIAPSAKGYLGVLANHAPLFAGLTTGKIVVRDESGATKTFVSKSRGFLGVLKNNVTIVLEKS